MRHCDLSKMGGLSLMSSTRTMRCAVDDIIGVPMSAAFTVRLKLCCFSRSKGLANETWKKGEGHKGIGMMGIVR
jgi:hypothetical protein